MVAGFGIPAEYRNLQARGHDRAGARHIGRAARSSGRGADPGCVDGPANTRPGKTVRLGASRTMLGVPLVRDDALIGVISLARSRIEAFTENRSSWSEPLPIRR